MICFLQIQTLKIDVMTAFNALTLIITFFSFVIIYNKSVKNSVNKKDVEDVKTEMKTYIDDKDKSQLDRNRALHHRIDDFKIDNDKDHDRIRRENAETIQSMAKQITAIYDHLLKTK